MREYLIILGREPELSTAELAAVARRFVLPLEFSEITRSLIVAKGDLTMPMLGSLAGVVKVAEVIGKVLANKASLVEFLSSVIPNDTRCEFGLSWYGDKVPRWLMPAGLELKNKLKDNGSHVRLVTSRSAFLSSVVVKKNKLLPPTGFEFMLYQQGTNVMVARTIWVQDFEGWSERDYGRPERNAKVGMLPPKLARIMLNLAEAGPSAGILDPFCGSGTVLQEAALLGYGHLVGVDVDSAGVERTRANFLWLKRKFPQLSEPALLVSDIEKLVQTLNNFTFDVIVTEPYLGPALRGHEAKGRLMQIQQELTEFYLKTLAVLTKLLKVEGRIVMVWPIIKSGNSSLALPLTNELKRIGLTQIDALPNNAPQSWHNTRQTLCYSRPDAHVIREIVVLKKSSLG